MSTLTRPWLFFDAGNVLVSDDPSGCAVLRELYRELQRTAGPAGVESPEDFMARRTAHTLAGGQLWEFVASHADRLPQGNWREFQKGVRRKMYRSQYWTALSPPIPGMGTVLRKLKSEGFRMALVANQPPAIEAVLSSRGLWNLFDVHAISDSLKLWKPDRRLFEWALNRASITPDRVIMVGDRIDNDIAPARALGMATAWFVVPTELRGWAPSSRLAVAYLRSVSEASVSLREPRTDAEKPHIRATTPDELLEGLIQLGRERSLPGD
jgi:HAD superfamily hydrolase (TIGR01509 family)